jgi:hypothetical protein
VVALPISGQIRQALYLRDGNLPLSVLSPGGKLLVQAREPAALRDLTMIAYTG